LKPARATAPLISIFGPTASGKTGVAIELARLLRDRGEDPVAINCDSIQVYRGLEILSGAADALGQDELEHRLIAFLPVDQEFSAGRYSKLAHGEIDSLLTHGRRPVLVGGTGLYLRAALADLDLRPPVAPELRSQVEQEIALRGPEALHAELPPEVARTLHPRDSSRIARRTELLRSGRDPAPVQRSGGRLWTAGFRRPTLLFGLADEPDVLRERIARRVRAMEEAGAGAEAAAAVRAGASRTARAAVGFQEFLSGDPERAATRHRQFARRQLTWMRRMEGVTVIERRGRSDRQLALDIFELACGDSPAATTGDAARGTSG
jgi:tRNA dimethylallyltransferase